MFDLINPKKKKKKLSAFERRSAETVSSSGKLLAHADAIKDKNEEMSAFQILFVGSEDDQQRRSSFSFLL